LGGLRMLYLVRLMRTTLRPLLTIGLGLLLAMMGAALTYSSPPAMQGTFGGTGAFFFQVTATPPQEDLSQIGSTDGIVLMGFFIVLIIVIPIFLRRKSWLENR
jgi:hypothetical protein